MIDEDTMLEKDTLERLTKLVHQQQRLEKDIELAEEALKELKTEHRQVSMEDIPDLLDELGLSELRLADGTKVQVKEDLKLSTTGKWREPILSWLRESGHDDVIKNEISVKLDKGKDNIAGQIALELRAHGLTPEQKQSVHPQTLGALVRELLEDGEDVPLEDIGAYFQKQTKLERA